MKGNKQKKRTVLAYIRNKSVLFACVHGFYHTFALTFVYTQHTPTTFALKQPSVSLHTNTSVFTFDLSIFNTLAFFWQNTVFFSQSGKFVFVVYVHESKQDGSTFFQSMSVTYFSLKKNIRWNKNTKTKRKKYSLLVILNTHVLN